MAKQRDHWTSSLGFILAGTGAAVGLGNLWKFPYITWQNGGGSFVLIYLVSILLVGIPVMIAEITLGRSAQLSTVSALEHHARDMRGTRFWSLLGWGGVATGAVVLGYYSIIAGWSISSFVQCIGWSLNGYTPPAEHEFAHFTANGWLQIGLALLFASVTAAIVMRGVSAGIEKASRLLMPILFVTLLLLSFNALTLSGAREAVAFLFTINSIEWHGVLEALGHAFFTLSLGMGAMITYGSYMKKDEPIIKSTLVIAGLDTLIALIACLIMYSILFTYPEVHEAMTSPVGMLFITIPKLFYTQMTGGIILAPVFFILVGFAALTSTISMLEVVVALMVDKLGVKRKLATIASAASIFMLTIACALSHGASAWFTQFNPLRGATQGFWGELNRVIFHNKQGVFNIVDHIASNWCLPIGGALITCFVGWCLDERLLKEQLKIEKPFYFKCLKIVLRYLAPILILIVIYGVNT